MRKGPTPINTPAKASSGGGVTQLVTIFLAWKALLLLVACASPGPGYDSSTQLLLDQAGHGQNHGLIPSLVKHVVLRLIRWDAVYFTKSSERGYAYEQEWAFSWAFTRVMARFAAGALILLLFADKAK